MDDICDINETNEEECIKEFFDGEVSMRQHEGGKMIRNFSMVN